MRCDRFCVVVSCALSLVLGCSKSSSNGFAERDGFSCDGGLCLPADATPLITVATCETEGGTAPVQPPQLVKTISGIEAMLNPGVARMPFRNASRHG